MMGDGLTIGDPSGVDANLNLLDVLSRHATHRAREFALADDDHRLTYADLMREVRAFAADATSQGVRVGHRVAMAMTSSARYATSILGVMHLGGVAAPINTRLTRHEMGDYLDRIAPDVVIVDESWADAAATLPYLTLLWREGAGLAPLGSRAPATDSSAGPTAPARSADAPALVIGTGGTTGVPKGALLSHRAVWMWAACGAFAQQLRTDDIELFGSPFFHSTLLTGLITPLFAGAGVRVLHDLTPASVAAAVTGDGANRIGGAPALLERILAAADGRSDAWRSIRVVQFGASKPSESFLSEVQHRLPGAQLITGYGSTEVGPATRKSGRDFETGLDDVGRPVPAATVRILAEGHDIGAAPLGTSGEILVSCPWQMTGYVGDPAATDAATVNGSIRSGDVGYFDEAGRLHLSGRIKEMILTGGESVFPLEVERELGSHPAVADIAVFGVPDGQWGERVEAAIVLAPGATVTLAELREHARDRLAGYKMPKLVNTIEALPLTANSKVDRRALRQAAMQATESTGDRE
jgi:acyl-CoA synthetase (AMP-forming)/AMP-acid ligase II